MMTMTRRPTTAPRAMPKAATPKARMPRANDRAEHARGRTLDRSIFPPHRFRDYHLDRDWSLSCVYDPRRSLPQHRLSKNRSRNRQWRRTNQSNAGHGYAAYRRSHERRAGAGAGSFDHQPWIGRSEPLLQLERRYVPDAAIRERRAGSRAAYPAADCQTHGESYDLRRVDADHRLQPDFGHYAPDPAVGIGQLYRQA